MATERNSVVKAQLNAMPDIDPIKRAYIRSGGPKNIHRFATMLLSAGLIKKASILDLK